MNNKFLSATCYFSVFFFPLLLPFIIYLVTEDKEVKFHAKRSLISHLIPTIVLIAGFVLFSLSLFSVENRFLNIANGRLDIWSVAPFIFTLLYSLLFLFILIWNVFQGVKMVK